MGWLSNHRKAKQAEAHREKKRKEVANGIFLGSMRDKRREVDLRYRGEGSGAIISPPGGGKTSRVIIPTLLTDPGTHIVFDPALEIWQTTHEQRERLGNDVVVLCPFPNDANDILHPDHQITDHGINLLGGIDFKGRPETVREKIKNRVELLLPKKTKTDEKSSYFQRAGRQILDFICLSELEAGRSLTLPNVRLRLLSGYESLNEGFVEAMESSAFAGELALLGNNLNSILTGAPQQFSGGYGYAADAVDLYDGFSSVGRHVTGGGFDPARLKSGKPVTVYVCYPGERVQTHSRIATATITFLLQQICTGGCGNYVRVLIDEAAELDLPIARFMNLGRKFNLSMVPAFQSAEGQIRERYGIEGVKQIFEACDLLWVASVRGYETCEMLSKMIGMKAASNVSLNAKPGDSAMPDQSFGHSHHSVPLMRPEELQRLHQSLAVVLVGNQKPMLVNKVGYFERPDLAALSGPNPYRG